MGAVVDMNVKEIEGLYYVTRMTGESNNYLGVRFASSKCDLSVIVLSLDNGEVRNIEQARVEDEVKLALEIYEKKTGQKRFVSEVRFVEEDSAIEGVYTDLMTEILNATT